jgi:hypothetical protein
MLEKANPSEPEYAQTPAQQSAPKPKVPWVPQRTRVRPNASETENATDFNTPFCVPSHKNSYI